MNILTQANIKAIYRVTGTPENFLTALRFKVWGFNKENEKYWKKLLPGDIVFFHSKGSDSKFIKRPLSCIIGFGVVGNNFFEDTKPLWIDEKIETKTYPYKFSFSEFYLFASIPVNDDWDSTSLDKFEVTQQIILKLLEAAIPLSDLDGFPHMGSYSGIQNQDIKRTLLDSTKKLAFYQGDQSKDIITKSAELKELTNEAETLRYGTTLTVFDDIKERILKEPSATYGYNVESLAKAEKAHFNIVSHLRLLFANKGYQVFSNNHVDLFAYKNNNALLVEAKSIENRNFITQSRKGIVQLFEYNYFEVSKFKSDKNLFFSNQVSLLATSDEPKNFEYIKFINSLAIKTIAVKDKTIINYGDSVNMDTL
jgi:hypothetical protein